MNTNMKKFALGMALVLGLAGMAMARDGGLVGGWQGWNYTYITASSGSVITGEAYVDSVHLSSAAIGAVPDCVVFVDTNATTVVTGDVLANDTQKFTPYLVFNTTGTLNSGPMTGGVGLDRVVPINAKVKNGVYYWKSGANSGGARSAVLKWRR